MIAPPSMLRRCRCSSLPSNANAFYEHLPPLKADTHTYDARGCNAADDCCTAISFFLDVETLFRDKVLRAPFSSLMMATHSHHSRLSSIATFSLC
jgi:hypothetical protein